MIHEAVIIQDVSGHPRRCETMRLSHPNVFAVSPPDCWQKHTIPFSVPMEWLSASDLPLKHKCWLRACFVGFAAVRELDIKADYIWFIESDCVASPERWKAMFSDHRNNPADCLSNPVRLRSDTPENPWWYNEGAPDWLDRFFIMACYRLSWRAVQEAIRCAEETREGFCEHALASILHRAGMTFDSVNSRQTHWNSGTFRTKENQVKLNPNLINHPIKKDSYCP